MSKALLISSILFFFIVQDSSAQLLKRLGERVESAATETVFSKTEEKTKEETGKVMDSIFDGNKSSTSKTSGSTLADSEIAASYKFQHRVEMIMTTGKDDLQIEYHLPDNGNYMCTVVAAEEGAANNYSIIDLDNDAMIIFMNYGTQKMKMITDLKLDENDTTDDEEEEYTITKTGASKSILGYNCEEYLIVGNDLKINAWITNETDIRFPSKFYSMEGSKKTNAQDWNEQVDGFAMEMTMVDTSKKKNNTTTLVCTALESSDLTINSNDYTNLAQ